MAAPWHFLRFGAEGGGSREGPVMPSPFSFDLHKTDGSARTGVIHTPRGTIRTPAFMPVAIIFIILV